jgi:hypothetical protein
VALAEAQKLARETHDPLPITRSDLGKRLHALRLLAASDIDTKRKVYTHRKRVTWKKGAVIDGLCLSVNTLLGDDDGADVSGVSEGDEPHPTQENENDIN